VEFVDINGITTSAQDAKISVFDRGFLYGDAVYEVTRSYDGVLFQAEAHMQRLMKSAKRIGMDLKKDCDSLVKDLYRVHAHSKLANAYVRLQVSRGEGPITLDPRAPAHCNFVTFVKPYTPFDALFYRDGCRVHVSRIHRNSKQALDPNIKSGNYLNNILAMAEGTKSDAHETLMVNHEGYLTEGCTSNFFLVKNNTLITPSDDFDILFGITRKAILEIAERLGIAVQQRGVKCQELYDCNEAFLSSSTREIMPVREFDDYKVSEGAGPITQMLIKEYKKSIDDYKNERRGLK
jgi:branched-chain amino acid aminotransferase